MDRLNDKVLVDPTKSFSAPEQPIWRTGGIRAPVANPIPKKVLPKGILPIKEQTKTLRQPTFYSGNAGLPNVQYQPKYKVGSNLQPNTNWLQGLPNLQAMFGGGAPSTNAPAGLMNTGGGGDYEDTSSPYATNAETLAFGNFTPSKELSSMMGGIIKNPTLKNMLAIGLTYNKEKETWLDKQYDLTGYNKEDIKKLQAEIDGGAEIDPTAPFSPQQQAADNPDVAPIPKQDWMEDWLESQQGNDSGSDPDPEGIDTPDSAVGDEYGDEEEEDNSTGWEP